MNKSLCIIALFFVCTVHAQKSSSILKGRVYNAKNNEPVEFATIVIQNSVNGTNSDLNGNFLLKDIQPGFYQLKVSAIGFRTYITETFRITLAAGATINVPLEEDQIRLEEVTVRPNFFPKREESPTSLRTIGIDEIEKNPGGNRDITKVIQSFPGVSSAASFRNDVIVRGGGPSENKFYLDGVEIPNLNHFATQGASGGPAGIINVDFIREVNFYSGAFPSTRGNALSSILEFTQKIANTEKPKFRATVGASDLAFSSEGPLSSKTTYLASVRRSYLQLLFSALKLPFLPTYNDFQFKIKTKIDDKTELSLIGLGALDNSKLNLKANETDQQRYILSYLPENKQWNYTLGLVLKHYNVSGYNTYIISHNTLNNSQIKYHDNLEDPANLTLNYDSRESETKFRFEHFYLSKTKFKITYGADFQYAKYYNKTFQKIYIANNVQSFSYLSSLNFVKYGFFGQLNKDVLNQRLLLSLGIRGDGNSYSSRMSNPLDNFSPRFSASYQINSRTSFSINAGRYLQLPAYTTLGYRNDDGILINMKNGIQMIGANHLVAGLDFRPNTTTQLSVEGFFKGYSHYPFSVRDSVSLASKGADFGVFGDEEVKSTGKGRAYGIEILSRFKDFSGFKGVLTYTYVRSEFTDIKGEYIPSSWDNRHLFTIYATRSLKRNWDFGFRWRYIGGSPYTPWDVEKSSLKTAWDANGRGYLDYSQFNKKRLGPFQQLDLRVDKAYYYKKWSLMLYVDIQNAYNFQADLPPSLIQQTDPNGKPLTDPHESSRYLLKSIATSSGTVLPTIGIMIEF
ncbi:MAG: TonB-dependent receptor [Prolixibacteraceae bacterium]|nr:TonB-dependent receptor [Prolixibacteraceae bacterium]